MKVIPSNEEREPKYIDYPWFIEGLGHGEGREEREPNSGRNCGCKY